MTAAWCGLGLELPERKVCSAPTWRLCSAFGVMARISVGARALVKALLLSSQLTYREIGRICGVSFAAVHYIKKELNEPKPALKSRAKGGRPPALTPREERLLLRQIQLLRARDCSFSLSDLARSAGLEGRASASTFYRVMRKNKYTWAVVKRKGVLSEGDKRLRVAFCKRHKTTPASFWTSRVCFYLDAVSFAHKLHPHKDSNAPGRRAWMKPSERLRVTGKAAHEGSGGRVLRFVVAVGHGVGLVLCERYTKMSAAYFSGLIRRIFPQSFLLCQKAAGKLFLQDNDPSQTSKAAVRAMKAVGAAQVIIPPRSPDLNAIENIFALTKRRVAREGALLRYESEADFERRVVSTLQDVAATHAGLLWNHHFPTLALLLCILCSCGLGVSILVICLQLLVLLSQIGASPRCRTASPPSWQLVGKGQDTDPLPASFGENTGWMDGWMDTPSVTGLGRLLRSLCLWLRKTGVALLVASVVVDPEPLVENFAYAFACGFCY